MSSPEQRFHIVLAVLLFLCSASMIVVAILIPSGKQKSLFSERSITAVSQSALVASSSFERPSWADLDHDGLDTRADLIATVCTYIAWNSSRTRVLRAECPDLYDATIISTDTVPQSIQIDHLYPASVAWYRRVWVRADGKPCLQVKDCEQYRQFYNDVLNLTVTRSKTNNTKSDLMPAKWCPVDPYARVFTAIRFKLVAEKWKLPLTSEDERGLMAWSQGRCAE